MQADNPLPWTDRHWDELRAVALEAARKSRVASTFLPLVGPFPADQATVPSNWMEFIDRKARRDDRRLEVRAGIHTGECERVGPKLAGLAVNVGARVSSAARPGEVLVSQTVKDLVSGSGLAFEDRGLHELKGVPGEWRVYAAV